MPTTPVFPDHSVDVATPPKRKRSQAALDILDEMYKREYEPLSPETDGRYLEDVPRRGRRMTLFLDRRHLSSSNMSACQKRDHGGGSGHSRGMNGQRHFNAASCGDGKVL
ncbi:hypothetical protein MRS44_011453 [Fusarium solani]|uniref:uncharacterized protein n=1 Tax=Fusarium solani TaxID=169388 RepID=UPI0032C414CA|nr:hypothetical protein MRS44_011453 [Fusarium solani]